MKGKVARARLPGIPGLRALVAAAAVLAAASAGRAAWDGFQTILLGDRVTAEFQGAALSEAHQFSFFVPADAVLGAVVTVAPDSPSLVPEVRLFAKDGTPVDTGLAQVGNTIRGFRFDTAGGYYLRVQALAGTGTYRLVTRVRYPAVTGISTTGAFAFDAPAGVAATATVRRTARAAPRPAFTGLTYPGSLVDLTGISGTGRLTRVRLPRDARYTLAFDPGTAGLEVQVGVRLFSPPRRDFRFGPVETTSGIATENRAKWLASPHADLSAPAFNNWNATNPPGVPVSCARCHSTPGYMDYLGADGTLAGVVDSPAPIGTVVHCDACHNDAASALTSVTFPSGLTVSGLGKEARCIVCHQGRESTVSMESMIAKAAPANDDTPSAGIKFLNIHYFAAGASLYGREAAGGYEYPEPGGDSSDAILSALPQRMPYDRKFTHVAQKDTCIECHDPHSQQIRIDDCAACHVNSSGDPVATNQDLYEIRMAGTVNDFDGDGDVAEGIRSEIQGLEAVLYAAMQDYATQVAGSSIEYRGDRHPYYFVAGTTTSYASWTTRLVRAAYNYQFALKDPGSFAHNGKYIVQLLYDSIADLNGALSALTVPSPVPGFASLRRNDPGHFDSLAEPYRHWDEDTDHLVDPSCARCHSVEGFQFVAKYGIEQTIPANLISGLSCESCHAAGTSFAPRTFNPNPDAKPERLRVGAVAFPYPSTATSSQISSVTIANGPKDSPTEDDSFICMTCHRGRESTLTLNAADAGATSTFTVKFKNSHYLAAGGTLYGSKAAVAYQYAGKTYAQRWDHDQSYLSPYPAPASLKARCEFCHMQGGDHSFQPKFSDTCLYCHVNSTGVDDLTPAFRVEDDYDGNPSTKPKAEFEVYKARLLAAIQAYCTGKGFPVNYTANYPYFVKDPNGNGIVDAGETAAATFDSKAFRATFNYNFFSKEPGAWAHNPVYTLQVLYDSIQDLGGDVTGLTRP